MFGSNVLGVVAAGRTSSAGRTAWAIPGGSGENVGKITPREIHQKVEHVFHHCGGKMRKMSD